MTLETGKQAGLTFIEILVVVIILSLLIGISVFFPHRTISRINLENASKSICEIINTARIYAITERQKFYVVFKNNSYGIYREDGNVVSKVYNLPQFIIIKEKTAGFSPVEFLPQGNAKQAGHIILEDTSTKKTRKIILYNLTGKTRIVKE